MPSTEQIVNNRLQKLAQYQGNVIPSKVKKHIIPYLWNAENAQRKGLNEEKEQWSTYRDNNDKPAVGPGIRVPQHGTYSAGEVRNMFINRLRNKWKRMINDEENYPGIENASPRLQAGMLDREWMGVSYPKQYRAIKNQNWDKAKKESKIYYEDNGERRRNKSRQEAWDNKFLNKIKSNYTNNRS